MWKKILKSFCSNPSLITSHPSEGKIKPCQQLVDDLLSRQLHIRRGVDRDKMLLCSMRSFKGEINWALIIFWTKSFGQNLRVAISGGEAVSVVRAGLLSVALSFPTVILLSAALSTYLCCLLRHALLTPFVVTIIGSRLFPLKKLAKRRLRFQCWLNCFSQETQWWQQQRKREASHMQDLPHPFNTLIHNIDESWWS